MKPAKSRVDSVRTRGSRAINPLLRWTEVFLADGRLSERRLEMRHILCASGVIMRLTHSVEVSDQMMRFRDVFTHRLRSQIVIDRHSSLNEAFELEQIVP